jgi:hypothetical protein
MKAMQTNKILSNARTSMAVEGFVIDNDLEEIGRKVATGELKIEVYIAAYLSQYKNKTASGVSQ